MDFQNVGFQSSESSESAYTASSTNTGCTSTATHGLQQSTSSIYSQAFSTLQSPSHQFDAKSPPRFSTVVSPRLMSPVHMQSSVQLTSLLPVTPSRVNSTAREICGSTGTAISDASDYPVISQTYTLPPTPLRVIPRPSMQSKPVITKKGKGKISVTFSPNILAARIRAQGGSAVSSLSMFSQCLSQFLSRSDTPGGVPPIVESIQRNELLTTASSKCLPSQSTPSVVPKLHGDATIQIDESAAITSNQLVQESPAKADSVTEESAMDVDSDEEYHPGKDEEDEDEEEEERKTVTNITKALNINIDMYQEMKKRRKKREFSSKLPKEVQGLMGEANICFAKGDCESALQMCMEIIRTGPWCPEPYELLAILYEEKGDSVKHLQYSLLAAHLQVGDVDNWLTLAKSCEEAGFLEQASHCYSKAMKLKPNDYKIMWAAAVIQQQLGNIIKSLSLFKAVVKAIPSSEANRRMTLARDIASACHANAETALGLEVMDEVAAEYPDEVRYEDLNVMCELALLSKQYRKVFDILTRHCKVEVQYNTDQADEEASVPTYVVVPPDLPAELKCKCVLASIPLDCIGVVQTVFKEMCDIDSTAFGDLQLDIVDGFIEQMQYRMALVVLDILVKSKDYSEPAVWMKKGECHQKLGEDLEEIECFKQVIEKNPGYANAYIQLCQVLRKLKRFKEAVEDAEMYELEDEGQMLLNYETFKVYTEWAAATKKKHDKLCKAGDLGLLMLANKLQSAFFYTKTILLRRVKSKSRNSIPKGDVRVTRKVGKHFYKHEDKKSLVAKGSATIISNDDWWDIFRDPESIALAVLTGHNSLATGTYKHSLAEYIRAHRQIPTEPMYTLLIGIIYIHIASQRFTTHKNTLVIQAIAFLNQYRQQRKCDQEAYYNIGRMYHQVGMTQFAMQWYKKALQTPPPVCDAPSELIDLKSEIAYNLATIYRKSGNIAVAMDYLQKYCVI